VRKRIHACHVRRRMYESTMQSHYTEHVSEWGGGCMHLLCNGSLKSHGPGLSYPLALD
jgi:hypothetical protein